jgi:ferrous iron transport protein B
VSGLANNLAGSGGRVASVALVGNPNSGKTTLFNALTGGCQKVGNYAGVTVERVEGEMFTPHGRKLRVLDLPGCYSLQAASPDEQITLDVLTGRAGGEARPELVVCVVDASALERHLNLVLQVIELGLPVVVALNMVDVAEAAGVRLDPQLLAEELGVPVVAVQADRAKGIIELKQALRIPLPAAAKADWLGDDPAVARRRFIDRLCGVAARRPGREQLTRSDRLDALLLHPLWGWVVLVVVMFGVFWSIFSFAEHPMGWIERGVAALGGAIAGAMPPGDLRDLLTRGIVEGVGGVVMFLPQIVLLFLFIGLLESSGYMARAAFMMDGVMSRAGLSGKAFLPLLSSYACAIPGLMATRTIGSAKERLATIFIAPWMSCSARLPVYLLLVPLLIGREEGHWLQALVLFGVYAAGTGAALVTARVVRGRLGSDDTAHHFMLELPPYRAPQWGYVVRHVFDRAWAFVRKAGTVILGLSILLWALAAYPKLAGADPADQLAHSLMGRLGHLIEPAVRPLGFDGRTGTAILTSFAAREVFVSSMAIAYGVEENDDESATRTSLRERLRAVSWPDGTPMFSPLTVAGLLVFFIYALQCLPTSAVVAREAGSWRWALGQFLFMGGFAWFAAFAVHQLGKLLGFQ